MIYDVIVVGTGAGGATVAKELSKNGLKVLILEKGKPYKTGTAVNYIKNVPVDFKLKKDLKNNSDYDFLKYPAELIYIEGMGGTTTVSLANACYSCSACYYNSAISQLKNHDLNLFEELIEASGDLRVKSFTFKFHGSSHFKNCQSCRETGIYS